MVLVGPSGCGKSTALRMVAGLEETTGGEIRIGDRVVNDVAPKDRNIAMVFQDYALYPHMTVCDNIAFWLKLRKSRSRRSGARRGGRQDPRDRGAAGAQARAALRRSAPARGAGSGDRPRARGVPDGRAALEPRRAAARPDARGDPAAPAAAATTTTIYVTHDQVEAMTMGDRIAVMNARAPAAGRHAAGALRPPGERVRRRRSSALLRSTSSRPSSSRRTATSPSASESTG